MTKRFPTWTLGLIGILLLILVPILYFLPRAQSKNDPTAHLPEKPVHVDHADIVKGEFKTGQDVTRNCLECHEDAATEFMKTTHWTWESKEFDVPWRDENITIGKANQINNFCIGTQGNENKCMSCHAGYGWEEGRETQQANAENVDCLACHADPGVYGKGTFGNPAEGIDLLAAARSVRAPTRENCGKCHFDGGGGNGVKHGDLDESLYFPSESLDVHMGGENNMLCTDCHWTENHQILGRMVADNYTIDPQEQVSCEQCHVNQQHEDERINTHLASVACQTCHVPALALEDPTKVTWDWSQAGQEGREDDHFTYLKIKGEFTYDKNFAPTYLWFNGNNEYRYLLGDPLGQGGITYINKPAGSIHDPNAKIFPFKLHIANQPYDVKNNYLLQPITSGEGGFWTTFDWMSAFELAQDKTGLAFSGEYGFTTTYMYWPTTHMVQPASEALQCESCHGENGRMDWEALGYPGDPIEWGGRK
ncbi:MAG TPA: tetrathionate reductase family octaheme c-type cytochrome [Anaerolineales bacterium]|nr:tetrathionate reductase family octaheme c-type cytochrome [Anaerolineales bacterium]HNA88165.1 tetrathionate reductase family octaheme c-type cytochrome [Anaerolineales bacterium]HNB36260.1 tetrathionate reductase family octaheme c-type cytochrome [Anaerolineales bacterium]HNC08973.1 tetrathionate reductase family octaheme c-type cytochrome [Anaerolineales bacterium]